MGKRATCNQVMQRKVCMKGYMSRVYPTEREVVNHSRRVKENVVVMTTDVRRKRVGRMVHKTVGVEGERCQTVVQRKIESSLLLVAVDLGWQ